MSERGPGRGLRRAATAVLLICLLAPAAAAAAASAEPAAAQQAGTLTGGSAAAGLPKTLPGSAIGRDALVRPQRSDVPPAGRRLTAERVGATADRIEKVRRERREWPRSTREVFMKGVDRWQVSYFARTPPGEPRKEIAQVLIDDGTGRVIEAWTDYQVPWSMARGYPGAFGRVVNAPWVWIPLALLFVAPFLRRPWGMLHLDLLVLSLFSASTAFFNAARIDIAVPLLYPLLGYLLARMLWIGLRRGEGAQAAARRPLRLLVPVGWLAIAVIFLLGFRVALNVTDSNVIDVGYAGVIGADRIVDGSPLYGAFPRDNASGDTYGPVVYLAYVPFEQAKSWTGQWDDLPAAHAAAIGFDLAACLLLFLIGRRVRGPDLGVLLAYAWVTYPFTLYALMSNSNDTLVAALVLAAVWVAGSPGGRGAFMALAGLTKFAPLALAPLFATHGGVRLRPLLAYAAGFGIAASLAFLPLLGQLEWREFWDHTIAFQAQRGSPFSVWGLYDPDVEWLNLAQRAVQIGAVLLALALAFVPRRRDVVGLAACSAAILLALQLAVSHWFYLYIPWFLGLVMIALLGSLGPPDVARPRLRPRPAPAR
ncbi:MAG: glycosyltransferase 87 family protein [Solirubrobacteraceae bacterium]|nr:glycosyltransferase 87 family protein [Solirubrobacteraceae bacterium]